MRVTRRVLTAGAAVIAASLLCFAPGALASSMVTSSGGMILVTEASTSSSTVTVGLDPTQPNRYLIVDSAGISTSSPPCQLEGPTVARCPAAGITAIGVGLGAFNDVFAPAGAGIEPGARISVSGDAGDDALTGRGGSANAKNDLLRGGSGDDTLRGLGDRDTIIGAGGNDRIFGGKGRDFLRGNAGADRINGGKGRDQADGGPGRDRFRSVERIKRR